MTDLTLKQQIVDWKQHHLEGKDLQRSVVKDKFKLWDFVIENKLMASPDANIRNKAILLLEDDTIYEYAFFKNEEEKPFEYEAYQDLIAQCKYRVGIDAWNNVNRFVMFVASNQIGKSRFLIGKARKLLFSETGKNIVIVTNNLKLTQFILSEVKSSLNSSDFADSWKEDISDVNNTTMLTVDLKIGEKNYTNRLICTPAGEGSLGYPIHYLFLDELDFYEDGKRLFWKIFYPRLNKTKGQCYVFSNPNPDISRANSILAELWDGDLFQRKFKFTFLDATWNTREEFDIAQRNSPNHIFKSTHLGEWSGEGGAFLSDDEIEHMLNKDWQNNMFVTDKPVYIAVDLGKMRDNTVIGVGVVGKPINTLDKYLDLNIKYTEKLPLKTDYDIIAERISQIKDYYEKHCAGVAVIAYDSTGQKTFGDFLKRLNISARGVDFSAKDDKKQRGTNKTLLYNNFKLMAENRKVKIVYTRDCELQLSKLEVKASPTLGLSIVENKTEGDHDDFPDMIAIMIHVAVRPSSIPVSIAHISRGGVEVDDSEEEDYVSTQEDVDKFIGEQVRRNRSNHYKSQKMFNNMRGM